VLAVLLTANGSSYAQSSAERAEASLHFDRALELIRQHAYQEALVEFERAYALSHDDAVLYNLGMAQVAVNRPLEAVDVLARYLASENTRPSAEERTRVEAELARQRARIGALVLDVQPDGATCSVDGRAIALPSGPIQLVAGEHRIVARLAGYQVETRDVDIPPGAPYTLSIALRALIARPTVRLPVVCAVPDVVMLIDDKLMWLQARSTSLQITAGAHVFTFRRAGYMDSVLPINVDEHPNAGVDCDLRVLSPLPAGLSATLQLRMLGEPGDASVDGRPFQSGGSLPIGRHRVQVTRAGSPPWTREIDLRPNQTHLLEVAWAPTPAEQHDDGAQIQSTAGWVAGAVGITAGLVALATYLVADQEYNSWKKADGELNALLQAGTPGPQAAAAIESKGQSNDDQLKRVWALDRWSSALAISAGVFVVGGVVLLWTAPKAASADRRELTLRVRGGSALELRAEF
jgi:hypothetical protein